MHHFGCVVPSYESLEVVKYFTTAGGGERKKREGVIEIGSGNGYWAYMLRRQGVNIRAVDNAQSEYRTLWISDTIFKDGEKFLREEGGGRNAVLLVVYPIVGEGFMRKVLEAYKGDIICVAGTQNANGYTGFRDRRVDEVLEEEGWKKVVQVALPSFAGKDEAMFVFERQS